MLDNARTGRLAQLTGSRLRLIVPVALVFLVAVAALWWYYAGRESTDDAQLEAHVTPMGAKVGGQVLKVHVHDNQPVKAGDVLVEIDPRDYQAALDRAQAELTSAEAAAEAASVGVPIARTETSSGVVSARGGLEQAQAAVSAAEREIEAATARLASAQAIERQRLAESQRATRDAERLEGLVAKDEVPRQQYDTAVAGATVAKAAADAAHAAVAEAQTSIGVAEQHARQSRGELDRAGAQVRVAQIAPEQLRVTRAQANAAQARVQQAKAALDQARLNVEYTTVKAPSDGVVSRKTVEPGQIVQAGQPLFALVDLDHLWVIANFKETQLADIRVGQSVDVSVDALGGHGFHGRVDSIAAATGARFSLLPPENATGNFVKVVQRVPVKITLDAGQDPEHRLRPGLSVVPVVHVR